MRKHGQILRQYTAARRMGRARRTDKGVCGVKGLYSKYEVRKRSDGTFVDNCFVLRPDRDDAAITALLAYANATSDDQLAQELREWVEFEQTAKRNHERQPEHILGITSNGR